MCPSNGLQARLRSSYHQTIPERDCPWLIPRRTHNLRDVLRLAAVPEALEAHAHAQCAADLVRGASRFGSRLFHFQLLARVARLSCSLRHHHLEPASESRDSLKHVAASCDAPCYRSKALRWRELWLSALPPIRGTSRTHGCPPRGQPRRHQVFEVRLTRTKAMSKQRGGSLEIEREEAICIAQHPKALRSRNPKP